jgi:hypothetical protein
LLTFVAALNRFSSSWHSNLGKQAVASRLRDSNIDNVADFAGRSSTITGCSQGDRPTR